MAVSQPCWRSSLHTSRPFLPGSITSRITRSRLRFRPCFKPLGPSIAVSTRYPSAARRSDTVRLNPGSSSTKRMFEFNLLLRGTRWNPHDETAADALFALDADRAAVGFHDLLYQI